MVCQFLYAASPLTPVVDLDLRFGDIRNEISILFSYGLKFIPNLTFNLSNIFIFAVPNISVGIKFLSAMHP